MMTKPYNAGPVHRRDIFPIEPVHAGKTGARCPGCDEDILPGGVMLRSRSRPAIDPCCSVDCILWVLRNGYAGFAYQLELEERQERLLQAQLRSERWTK
jgi:hypothetical protein